MNREASVLFKEEELPEGVGLRAAVDSDLDELYAIHRAALREHVAATWGWDETDQRRRFGARVRRDDALRVIQVQRTIVGFVAIQRDDDRLCVRTLEIDPRYQGRGIGSAILRMLLKTASAHGWRVTLQVLRVNPALLFYRRRGFRVVGETPTHWLMEWETDDPLPPPC